MMQPVTSPITTETTNFGELFQDCVSSAFRDLLGPTAEKALIFHVLVDAMASDLHTFHQRLYGVFHETSFTLEHVILLELYHRLGVQFVREEKVSFADSVEKAKKIAMQKESMKKDGGEKQVA
jgi:hypothetical protein